MGLLVEVIAHELARSTENALAALEALRGRDVPEQIGGLLNALRSEMTSVSKRVRVLDPLSVSGRQRKEAFDVGTLIEDILSGHEFQFERHKVKLKVNLPDNAIRIRAVKGMIVQILENLLSNSLYWLDLRKQHEPDFQPQITIAMEGEPFTITYEDNGRGIAQENREGVFRAFFSLKEKSKRRGLGLYIARDCAGFHGGSLMLDSHVNRQTGRLHRFVLQLPGRGCGLMTELKDLLAARGITRAVVIDDVFDTVPRPDELNDGDWPNFFDDLGDAGTELLRELYEGYEEASTEELKASEDFITVVWENRTNLPQAASDHLFREYEETKTTERTALNSLVAALEALGLACTTMGRELGEVANQAELIFVDLFLGFHQIQDDMGRAVQRVRELLEGRVQNPPLVVLMSRSPRLQEKRNEFRDTAGLLGSTFRVVSKADLATEGTLETLLTRLANHYEDAKRVAGFVHAWDSGLDQARQNFIRVLRRLDLSDLAQIRALLLDFERQNLGEYLLDVADRVLQHEIEADDNTIGSALELNKIDVEKYPAPII